MQHHVPIMVDLSTDYLIQNQSGTYFDGTLGFGGHTSAFLSKLNRDATIIATDKDANAIKFCKDKFADDNRVKIFNTSFTEIKNISILEQIDGFDGVFVDLGVSSFQFDNKDSGFTYREDTVLDLRMNKSEGDPAHVFLNTAEAEEIANVLFNFGEEKKSRLIAKRIARQREERPIKTTFQLKQVIEEVIKKPNLNKSLSRVFQALRIYVNNELDELNDFLEKAHNLLKSGGRLVVLSYHSLEDRIVKEFFKYQALKCICAPELPICMCDKVSTLKIITRKPLVANEKEVEMNSRSRSAKLRVAEKI